MSSRTSYVLGLVGLVGTALFLYLASGALGIIGDGGRDDRWYALVLAVGLVGALVARFRPAGLALTGVAMAAAMVVVAVIAVATGLHERPGASVVEILGLTAMFGAGFCAAAWLLWRAAAQTS